MKKFISMLLVTAFMLAVFPVFEVPTLAVDDTFYVTGPYYEENVTFDLDYECSFTVESGGMYIIQTFGFCEIDDENTFGGNGGTIDSMTLINNSNDQEITFSDSNGYGDNGFMYVLF